MWLNKINEMSVGPLWVLRSPAQAPRIGSFQSEQNCPACGAPWLHAGSDAAWVVLPEPLTDARAQTLLRNCLQAAGWREASIFMLHQSCSLSPGVSLQNLHKQLTAGAPRIVMIFGSAVALQLDPGLVRGQIHSYQNTRLIVTHHPDEMIATPALKAQVWADLCLAHAD